MRTVAMAARHRGLLSDDVFVASYPRSGNTWVRFLLADLTTGERPDFPQVDRLIPRVGRHDGAPRLAAGHRLIKTHEAYRPAYRRAIYLVRDVRNVLVSWYGVTRPDPDDLGDFDGFVDDFVTERASPYGCWIDHVRGWLRAPEDGAQVLVCRFEELRAAPQATVERIAAFIGLDPQHGNIERALARNSAAAMRELEGVNVDYLRRAIGYRSSGMKGVDGTWRNHLDERHLRVMRPMLTLNAELGYGD
jgi:Sulfotransferase domain